MKLSVRPFSPVSPGEILEEELEARGWSQRDLAAVLGRPVQAVNEIIAGKKAITPETAISLSQALGTSPEYWLNLEASYRLDLLHSERSGEEDQVERRSRLFSKAPVNELIRRGWIRGSLDDLKRLEQELDGFLKEAPFAARKTEREQAHTPSQIAWASQVRKVGEKLKAEKYARSNLESQVSELRQLSVSEQGTRSVPDMLKELGVRCVFVDPLPGTRIDGCTLWLDEHSPLVGLSLRYDRVDWFWFTLMHELAHVVTGQPSLDLQLVGNDADRTDITDIEKKADRQASEWLVPADALKGFIRRTKPYYSRTAILTFANSVQVNPGIVVGQLQNRGEIPYSHHRNLLTRVRHLFLSSTKS